MNLFIVFFSGEVGRMKASTIPMKEKEGEYGVNARIMLMPPLFCRTRIFNSDY